MQWHRRLSGERSAVNGHELIINPGKFSIGVLTSTRI